MHKNQSKFNPEERSINLQNEKGLHSALKNRYAVPGDKMESKVDGFIIDLVRNQLLIEIQTRNFTSLRNKLTKLLPNHQIRLVYPIIHQKWITTLNADSTTSRKRKSPKTGRLIDLFAELLYIPAIFSDPHFSLEVILVDVEEIRHEDGKGSWRRKGVSIIDYRLLNIVEHHYFFEQADLLQFLPPGLPIPFSNKLLAQTANYPLSMVRKMTYCLKKMDAIYAVGKRGNEILYSTSPTIPAIPG